MYVGTYLGRFSNPTQDPALGLFSRFPRGGRRKPQIALSMVYFHAIRQVWVPAYLGRYLCMYRSKYPVHACPLEVPPCFPQADKDCNPTPPGTLLLPTTLPGLPAAWCPGGTT